MLPVLPVGAFTVTHACAGQAKLWHVVGAPLVSPVSLVCDYPNVMAVPMSTTQTA